MEDTIQRNLVCERYLSRVFAKMSLIMFSLASTVYGVNGKLILYFIEKFEIICLLKYFQLDFFI